MDPELLTTNHNPTGVALSVLVAAFASYVALDLARRVRSEDGFSETMWTVAGALVMGSGIWSMHFLGMLSFSLSVPIGFDPVTTFLSWVAAIAVSALALGIAGRERLTMTTLSVGSVVMGAGICAMHYIGMAALDMAPGIVWDPTLVAVSAVIACLASASALLIFFGMRRLEGLRARAAQVVAALAMGGAISGMHYTGMAAAGFAQGSVCLSSDGLGGSSLGTMILVAIVMLLSITLFTSALDARLQTRANRLARSLQVANEELRQRAFVDPLTGIPNRTLFDDRLAQAAARVDRHRGAEVRTLKPGLALLFIDVDGFKAVNDSLGHAAGDGVLRLVGERLKTITRATDTLARIGGDEFVLLVDEITDPQDVAASARRVLLAMELPFEVGARRITLSCSIGVAVYPEHGCHERLLACADLAMYRAKRAGGATFVTYEPHMHECATEQLELLEGLREALSSNQFHLDYQPKFDARTGRLCGVEALLRWTHPQRGLIGPAVFIPLAERFGLIVPIGNWVIEQALRQQAHWAAEGHPVQVAINLSAYQLRQPDVVDRFAQVMRRHATEPAQVICEITESVAMENTQASQTVIEGLSAAGVRLSIDDFGTGYSSLASLRNLKLHELKIDRSFVKDVDSSADARAIVDAVVRLAHALSLRVVAEGVETRAQRDTLVDLGCDELQGYHFSRPLSPTALAETFFFAGPRATQPAAKPVPLPA